jgi:two-component system cell cycle sensor histidine kinase/response regulator CckA
MVEEKENHSFPLINGRVLLIDDEAVVREVGSEMLESMGISCIVADDGEKGLQIYKEKKDEVALVILDIEMPGISGDKVYDMLKEINPELKILLTSGYARSYLEAKYFKRKLGEMVFMPKPFQMDLLTHKLKTILKM